MLPRFVNNGFKPYVEQLYQAAPVFQTRFFFIKVLLVLPTLLWQILRDTFIEVILVFLFFLIVNKMSQGRDMVVSFFEPEGLYGIARVGFTTLTIIIYSVCMWLVPVFLFEYRDKLKSKNPAGTSGVSLFDTHLFFAHRILALLPFWIFCYAIHHTLFMNIVIFMGIIAELIALHYIYNHVSLRGKIRIIHWIVTILILIAGAIVWIYYQHQYLLVKHFYTVFVFLISFAMYMSFHACDKKLLAAKMTKPVGKFTGWHYKTSHIIYIAMAAFQIITMILCIWVFNLKSVVPESLLLFIFSFYVFFIDLIHYVAKLSNRWRFWINSLGFIFFVLIGLRLFMSFNHDRINYKDTKEKYIASDLKAMEDYFEVWKKRIDERPDKTKPYPIVLVSGEGGGSRAGLWFSQAIVNMDFLSGGLMKDHIFSISTVSGSSVGLGSVLSYWTFCKEANLELGEQRWRLYPSKVFKYNFVGGSILGLTVTDFFNSLIPGPKRASDRNAELQREEAVCVQRSIKEAYSKKPLNKFNLFKRKDGYSADSLIMCRDFLSFFYDKLGPDSITKIKADLPLCFINTCRSNDGRRGIFSPVILGNKDFIDAIDLTRYIYSSGFKNDTQQVRGLGKAISLGTACNTSELFPFFSAPAFIDNLGYFVDGGYHENSGLKTTMEIYYKLKSLLDASNLKDSSDYTISIIYLKNGKYDKKYYPEVLKPTLPGLQPLVALSNIPFNGNASYFEETASNELKGNFIRFQLDYGKLLDSSKGEITKKLVDAAINKEILDDISSVQLVEYKDSTNTIKSRMDTTLNFPLARWLSNYIITRLRDNCDYVCQTEKKLQALINLINPESRRVEYPAQPPEKK